MTGLRPALAGYLDLRRGLGFKLDRDEKLLDQFITYLEQRGTSTITVTDALAWATLPVSGRLRMRITVVRGFAAYLATLDPSAEVPPPSLLPGGTHRAVPYLYSAADIGVRLGSLREPVSDRAVQAVRRPVVLMADVLAGRAVEVDRAVVPATDGCPAKFRPLRDDYLASCRRRGNAEATVIAKDRAASRFLGYLDEVGTDDLAALDVRDVPGFLLRQRGLRRKTIAAMRSCLADFLEFLATAGRTPRSLAGRLPPHRHVRHESEPHLWTADEIRRVLAVIGLRFGKVDGTEERDREHVPAREFGTEGLDGVGQAANPGPPAHDDADAQVDVADTGAGHLLSQPPDDLGAGAVESAARAWRIVVHHWLRSGSCQTISTRRAPGRRAVPMLVNAAQLQASVAHSGLTCYCGLQFESGSES
jgi:hypothetical protein